MEVIYGVMLVISTTLRTRKFAGAVVIKLGPIYTRSQCMRDELDDVM